MVLLTTLTSVQCAHGMTARVSAPLNDAVSASSGRVLGEKDVHVPLGPCPFSRGSQPSPCARVTWSNGAQRVTLKGRAVLTTSSIGTCYSADGAPQGLAIIGSGQAKASAG